MSLAKFTESNGTGLRWFFGIAIVIALINLVFAFTPVIPGLVRPLSLFAVVLLMALPVLAIFKAGDHAWTPGKAALLLVGGIGLQAASIVLVQGPLKQTQLGGVVFQVGQIGLMMWCVALGALLATMLKEKNLLLPVALFLIAFDFFLVLTPMGFTQKIMKAAPQILEQGGYRLPEVTATPTMGPVGAFAYVGPADFVFMGMFFIALFRWKMRVRETLLLLIPALIAYMGIVLFTGQSLPALVPIGLVVLLVNLREFKMNRDEWIGTGLVAALAAGLLIWSFTQPKRPVAPSPSEPVPATAESEGSPAPRPQDPPPSPTPGDGENTPSRP